MGRFVTVSALVILVAASGTACDRILGERLDVSLRTFDGLDPGDRVYLAGIRVGSVGEPALRDGLAIVPVYIRDMTLLPKDGMVFLVTDDAKVQRKSLSIIALRGATPSGKPPLYQGAANQLELAGVVGTAEAARLMRGLAEWKPSSAQ